MKAHFAMLRAAVSLLAAIVILALTVSGAAASEAAQGTQTPDLTVLVPSLNVRSGPGENFSVVFSARGGDRFSVLEKQDKWLRVRAQDGREGWAAGWLTSPVR